MHQNAEVIWPNTDIPSEIDFRTAACWYQWNNGTCSTTVAVRPLCFYASVHVL